MAVRLPSLALQVAQPLVALVPALSALLAIPLLDEWPNETDWVGIVLISAGVYLTSGGPLPSRNPKRRFPPPHVTDRDLPQGQGVHRAQD